MRPARAWPGDALAAAMAQPDAPGVIGVAVVEDYRLAWSEVAGGRPGRLFQAGSVAKPVAALAALELAARGAADLDADVNQQLTSWRLPGPRRVSLRELLGHTAGTGVPFYPGYPRGAQVPTPVQSLDGAAPAVTPAVRVDPAAAGRFGYSGGGYLIVQQLITDLTGLPFGAAASELVLGPLGMHCSTFEQPLPARLWPAAARDDWHVYPEAAAAGLWTTPADLARFLAAVQAALAGRESPVSRPAAALMVTPRAQLPAAGDWNELPALGIAPPDRYGLGFFLDGEERFGHIGGAHSFCAIVYGSTADGSGAVIMAASDLAPFPFRLLLAIGDQHGWASLRMPPATGP